MPEFNWEATSSTGDKKKGTMEAANPEAIHAALRRQGLNPTKVKAKPKEIKISIPGFSEKVGTRDIVIFTRQFATMIDAGLPLVQCLEILASQADNKTLGKTLATVQNDVEGGAAYAEALGRHPKVFDELYVNMVAAGETGGILDTILNRLAAYMEKAMSLKKKVKSAMVYPITIMFVAVGVIGILMVFVIPKVADMFTGMGGELPAITQIVIDMSHFAASYKMIFAIGGGFRMQLPFQNLLRHREGQEEDGRNFPQESRAGAPYQKGLSCKVHAYPGNHAVLRSPPIGSLGDLRQDSR
jgi:type IV pilus assembly protein PilC